MESNQDNWTEAKIQHSIFDIMATGIYKIAAPDGKVYIGQALNYARRIKRYYTDHVKSHPRLYASILSYGIESHEISFIQECTKHQLNHWERYYQDLYDVCGLNGLNCRLTATEDKPAFVSQETRDKMSIGQTKRYRSPEELEYLKNRLITINKKRTGRTVSEATLEKMSKAVKGTTCEKRQGFNHFNSKVILNTQSGIYYGSAKLAAIAHNINYATLKDYLSGRRGIRNKTSLIYV